MERGAKDVFMNLICMLFCVIGFLITLGLVSKSMIIVTGVLAIILGVFHFMWRGEDDEREANFLYAGLFSILFGIILFFTGSLEKYKPSYITMAMFFIYGAITSAIVNIIKGYRAYRDGESGLRIAYSFIFALATILTFLPACLAIGGATKGSIEYFYDSRATYIIALLVISVVPLAAFILMIIDYIANRGVSTSYSANRSYNNRRNNHSD